ncbi:hypothetical protein OROGR_024741 [Orobanche gracilis]
MYTTVEFSALVFLLVLPELKGSHGKRMISDGGTGDFVEGSGLSYGKL